MSSKVAIVSGVPICQNPRVVKEADALAKLGHDVHVLSAIYNEEQVRHTQSIHQGKQWSVHFVAHQRGDFSQQARWQFNRIYNRLAKRLPISPSYRLKVAIHNSVSHLTSTALKLKADFYSLHLEPSMFVARELARDSLPFSFDLEDWHSEDAVYGNDLGAHKALRDLECFVLSRARFVTTTSNVLASAVANDYACTKPHVIYNSFPDNSLLHPVKCADGPLHICWFSQTIGRGRGLELLCDAIPHVKHDFKVSIRGNVTDFVFVNELVQKLGAGGNCEVLLLPLCSHYELEQWLPSHHVGFASEIPHCLNRDLSITNKMFQYMQAGLCVVATDTQAQLEVANAGQGIHIVRHRESASLVGCLELLCNSRETVVESGRASRRLFDQQFSWAHSEKKLQCLFDSAMKSNS